MLILLGVNGSGKRVFAFGVGFCLAGLPGR